MQKQDPMKLFESCKKNVETLKQFACGSNDLVIREVQVAETDVAVIASEGMVDAFYFSVIITDNLCAEKNYTKHNGPSLFQEFLNSKVISPEQKTLETFQELFDLIYSGFGVILVDGMTKGIVFGAQGFNFRSIQSPTTDENIKGSKEGFVEAIKINQTLVRRRMKTPNLVFQSVKLGNESRTECALVYLNHIVSKKLLKKIEKKLSQSDLDMVLESGSVKMVFTERPLSLFSEIGITERPDTFCAKLYEGKVGLIIDGTPFALIIPFLFAEHFQSLDDYEYKTVYTNFLRFAKYSAFLLSFLLPGLYVAIATFHPEILPDVFMEKIQEAETSIAYPFLVEGLVINFAYEIMREAGLRLPKEIGHAISIVGGLIIGDAAVNAGIISAPMVLIAAFSAISAFVIPTLMDSLVLLRFLFLFLGGFWGMYGIALGLLFVLINMCVKTIFGIPFSSGIAPTSKRAFTSLIWKSTRQQFASKSVPKIQRVPGAQMDQNIDHQEAISEFCRSLDSPIMKTALALFLVLLIPISVESICVFTQWVQGIFPKNFSVLTVILTMLVTFLITIHLDLESSSNAGKIIAFFLGLFLLIQAVSLFMARISMEQIFIALKPEGWIQLIYWDLLLMLLLIPFLQKKGQSAFFSMFAVELFFVLIVSLSGISHFAQYSSLQLIPLTLFAYLKLSYSFNILSEGLLYFWKKAQINRLKPTICTLSFIIAGALLIFLS